MNNHFKKLLICLVASMSTGCLLVGCKSSRTNVHYNKAENTYSVTQSPSLIAEKFRSLNHKVFSQKVYTQMIPTKRDEPYLIYRFNNNNIYIQPVQSHAKDLKASITKMYEKNSPKIIKRAPKSKRALVGNQILQEYKSMIANIKNQNHMWSRIRITFIHRHKNIYHIKGHEYSYLSTSSHKNHLNSSKNVTLSIKTGKSGLKLISYNGTPMHHNYFSRTSDQSVKNLLSTSHIKNSNLGY